MPHLYSFRQGWRSEALARFLLSEMAFVAEPSTVADDVGSDFFCTLFSKKRSGTSCHLLPKNSFVIQIKSSGQDFDLSDKVEFLKDLELPFFLGVVDRGAMKMDIYSGRGLHFLVTMKGAPRGLRAAPVDEVAGDSFFDDLNGEPDSFRLKLPRLATLHANASEDDVDAMSSALAEECSLIHQNISTRRMEEYILDTGTGGVRVFAGSGSADAFRRNVCLRMAEAFCNLAWLRQWRPGKYSSSEFEAYSKAWLAIRPFCPDDEGRRVADQMYETTRTAPP